MLVVVRSETVKEILFISLKISTNGIGFITSYISAEPRFIPGMLVGIALTFLSIMIPEK